MEYSFNIEHAKKYGVDEAVMIKNIMHWIIHNKANNKNTFNGRTWTYNSVRAWAIIFPFWSVRQIRRIIESLIKKEVLISGNFNKLPYDKTKWYAFKNEKNMVGELTIGEKSLCQNGQRDLSELTNTYDKNDKPIPYINTDNKHKYIQDVIKYWNEKNIIKHKESVCINYLKKRHIKVIDDLGIDKLYRTIDNYKKVVASEAYYFSHKWNLWDFIARGVYKFVDEADPLNNFLKNKDKVKVMPKKLCTHCGVEATHTETYCLSCGKDYEG